MTTTHVSAFVLDQLALDALDAAAAEGARAHLATCAGCRADEAVAAEARAHFTVSVLPRIAPRARRRLRWPWLAVPALAVAAIMLLTLHGHPVTSRDDDLLIKGTAAWQVFANRDGQTFPIHDGAELAAGDRIRFVVTPAGAAYVIIASVDGSGAASIYYPYNGARSAATSGPRSELPDSIVLDAAPGPERLFAVFSDEPIEAELVIARLSELGGRGATAIRAAHALELPAARAQLTLVFEKVAP
jgi:hypothetical protein